MPVVPGKPGTRRIRGRVRAQLQQALRQLNQIIAYSDKLAARVPPVVLLTIPQRATLFATTQDLEILISEVNT